MASTRPRALFIAPATPERRGNGLAMRLAMFHDALSKVADVHLVIVYVSGPHPDAWFRREFGGTAVTVPTRGREDTQFKLLSRVSDPDERLAHFRRYGRGGRHAYMSSPVLEDVRRHIVAVRPQLVHTARLHLSEAAPEASGGATLTLDLDEDDAWAWRRVAATQSGVQRDWTLAEAEAEDRLLHRIGPSYSATFVSGASDAATLGERHPRLPLEVVPNAIVFPKAARRADDGRTLLFVGSFGYQPNIEGVLWFAREVWPLVKTRSTAPPRLRLVGRNMPAEILGLAAVEGIEVVGPVDEIAQSYAEATLAIAPLHSGAGTRLKLIEAAAYGVPIVSTRLAARGLEFATGEAVWLADDADGFATAISAALGDAAERGRRAGAARQAAQTVNDWSAAVDRLACRFESFLVTKRSDEGDL